MREQPGADGKVWWNDRQPRFTVVVLGIYALVIFGFELGLGRGDRIGLAGGGAAVYALMIAFYGLLANVCYELVAKAEALVGPQKVGAYRRWGFALAVAIGVAIPIVVGALI